MVTLRDYVSLLQTASKLKKTQFCKCCICHSFGWFIRQYYLVQRQKQDVLKALLVFITLKDILTKYHYCSNLCRSSVRGFNGKHHRYRQTIHYPLISVGIKRVNILDKRYINIIRKGLIN